jgi:Protein of unknown function (DUF3465)
MTSTRTFILVVGLLLIGSLLLLRHGSQGKSISLRDAQHSAGVGCSQVTAPFDRHESDVWLSISGKVSRILPDELGQFRHQRFTVSCPSGQTVLIVNDVSIGQRVPVHGGASVIVRGQYIWDPQGGLLHFTHHAQGGGQSGWIEFQNTVYSLGPARLNLAARGGVYSFAKSRSFAAVLQNVSEAKGRPRISTSSPTRSTS